MREEEAALPNNKARIIPVCDLLNVSLKMRALICRDLLHQRFVGDAVSVTVGASLNRVHILLVIYCIMYYKNASQNKYKFMQ